MLQPSNTGAVLADPELSAVYAESQNRKRKRHDSLVTLTALEMVFATRLDEHVHHTTDAARSPLLTERHVHRRITRSLSGKSSWLSAKTVKYLFLLSLTMKPCPWIRPC